MALFVFLMIQMITIMIMMKVLFEIYKNEQEGLFELTQRVSNLDWQRIIEQNKLDPRLPTFKVKVGVKN